MFVYRCMCAFAYTRWKMTQSWKINLSFSAEKALDFQVLSGDSQYESRIYQSWLFLDCRRRLFSIVIYIYTRACMCAKSIRLTRNIVFLCAVCVHARVQHGRSYAQLNVQDYICELPFQTNIARFQVSKVLAQRFLSRMFREVPGYLAYVNCIRTGRGWCLLLPATWRARRS